MRIYLFHRISQDPAGWGPAMPPEIFERCIRFVSRLYSVQPLHEALDNFRAGRATKNVACITFDDGFRDNLEIAVPILDKYGCCATFYVITDSVDTEELPWNNRILYLFGKTRHLNLSLTPGFTPTYGGDYVFSDDSARIHFGRRLVEDLGRQDPSDIRRVCGELESQWPDVSPPRNLMMNWEHLRELVNRGHSIGSHTTSHPFLSHQVDDVVRVQLADSRRRIQQKLGEAPRSLAYPYGSYSGAVEQASEKAGYDYALRVGQRFVNKETYSPYAVPRMDIYAGSGWPKTLLRLLGFRNLLRGE